MLIREKMQMQTIQLKTVVGEDGILQIQMPPELKHKSLEILIVFQFLPEPETNKIEQDQNSNPSNWHEFIEKTYGCLADDPIERYSQGEYEIRVEIE